MEYSDCHAYYLQFKYRSLSPNFDIFVFAPISHIVGLLGLIPCMFAYFLKCDWKSSKFMIFTHLDFHLMRLLLVFFNESIRNFPKSFDC